MGADERRPAAGTDGTAEDERWDDAQYQRADSQTTGQSQHQSRGGRKKDACTPGPLRWPQQPIDQYELFDVWHLVAMRRVHREKREQPFRTLAVIRQALHWKSGKFDHTNAYLAELAGSCHPKTIEREIQRLTELQLVEYVLVRVRSKSGKQVLRRIVSLTMPGDVEPGDIMIDVNRHARKK